MDDTNHDATWPEMAGKDLSARFPGIELTNLTSDGATTNTVLGSQLPKLRRRGVDGNTLVTLTVGGNDLLNALGGQEDLIAIRPRAIRASSAQLTPDETRRIFFLSVLVIPELLMFLGLTVWWRRSTQ